MWVVRYNQQRRSTGNNMAKNDITAEAARVVIDRVAQELGLLVAETSGFLKVQGPTNKQRIYVQRSKFLGRIDTTLPTTLEDGTPIQGTKPLSNPNGSVTCHLDGTLENLEFHLRRLGDGTIGVQVPNKPRPFAATKQPARKPKPTAEGVDVMMAPEPTDEFKLDGLTLKQRLKAIATQARSARIRRYLENDDSGKLTEDMAADIVDGKATFEELVGAVDLAVNDALAEAGIEVNQ